MVKSSRRGLQRDMASTHGSGLICTLRRLHTYLEFATYVIAVILTIGYGADYWSRNEAFYRIDVDHTKWVTALPAHTICPVVGVSSVRRQMRRLAINSTKEAVEFVRGLLDPRDRYCRHCERPEIRTAFKDNFRELAELVSEPCESLFLSCRWNGKPFQCCRHFHRNPTKRGTCFTLNSKNRETLPFEPTTSSLKPRAELEVELSSSARVFIHDSKDVIFGSKPKIKPGQRGEITYKFMEWTEDPTSRHLSPHVRNCTLSGEAIDGFDGYTRSGCKLLCEAREQIHHCGCKHHRLPKRDSERDCDLAGLLCLDHIFGNLTGECNCREECSRLDVTYIQYSVYRSSGTSSIVNVRLSSPPTERIVLTSRVTPISLIVTLACLSRLFTTKTLYELVRDGCVLTRAVLSGTDVSQR